MATPSLLSTVAASLTNESVSLAARVFNRAGGQWGHLAVDRHFWLAALGHLTLLEHLNLTQAKVFSVLSIISDVDKLARLSFSIVTLKLDQLFMEATLKLSAWFVLCSVAIQDLHNKDGKLLICAWTHGDPHVLD